MKKGELQFYRKDEQFIVYLGAEIPVTGLASV